MGGGEKMENNREEFNRQIELLHFAYELRIQRIHWKVEAGLALYIAGLGAGLVYIFPTAPGLVHKWAVLIVSIVILAISARLYVPTNNEEIKVRKTTRKKFWELAERYYDPRTLSDILSSILPKE
jgi:hypothetical protein